MTRPPKFTEPVARERRRERLRELYPEYEPPKVAPTLYDGNAASVDKHRAERARSEFDKRSEKERKALAALAADLIPVLEPPQQQQKELVAELGELLAVVRWEWKSRRAIIPDALLPILGGVQPKHGEMRATLMAGLKHAEKLRDWYRSIPAALLYTTTVSFAHENPALGLVIERLA